MFSKKEMVIGISLLIVLVLGIGFITTQISNKEEDHEYKDWKKQTTVVNGKVIDIVKQGEQPNVVIQTKDDKQIVNTQNKKYHRGETVKLRIYKSNGKIVRDLSKESDITNEKSFEKYQQSQLPQWKDINKLYGN